MRALDDIHAVTAAADNEDGIVLFHPRSVASRADTGRYAAGNQAGKIKRNDEEMKALTRTGSEGI